MPYGAPPEVVLGICLDMDFRIGECRSDGYVNQEMCTIFRPLLRSRQSSYQSTTLTMTTVEPATTCSLRNDALCWTENMTDTENNTVDTFGTWNTSDVCTTDTLRTPGVQTDSAAQSVTIMLPQSQLSPGVPQPVRVLDRQFL